MPLRIFPKTPIVYLVNKGAGSITVFLSLVSVLIFALLGTLLETARFTACENHGERTLRTSAEALLTEYSRPLYDNYGLFFIEDTGTPFAAVISRYAGDTFEAAEEGTTDFFQGQIQEIAVTDRTYLGDKKAAPLQKEICEKMLRSLTKKQLKKFLEKSSSLANAEEEADQIEKTVEEEKEMAELDKELLQLMRLIDGVTVSGGTIKMEKNFVKMFAVHEKKSQNFGITEVKVWEKMKSALIKLPDYLNKQKKSSLLSKVNSVISIINQAITCSERLKTKYKKTSGKTGKYAEYNKRMKNLIDSLSVLEGNLTILKKSKTILEQSWNKESKGELEELWGDYDTSGISFDYTGVGEEGGGDNPVDMLGSAWGDGILHLVCDNPQKISESGVKNPDSYAKLYEEQEKEESDYNNRVKDFTGSESVNLSGTIAGMGSYAMDEFCLDSYIQERFSSYVEKLPGWKKTLQYQWEYIVAGKSSDKANLESVLNRILILRSVLNFVSIYKDGGKKSQAYAAAAAVVGFTGLEPLIRLTQTFILLAWAMVESLVDIAGLLQGRNVPVIKTSSQILTTFSQIFQINQKAITTRAKKLKKAGKSSFGYKEYLQLFLAATGQGVRRYRIMDLIQWDMVKNGYTGFQLGKCVYSIEVEGKFSFPAKFFRFPTIQQMLKREINAYPAQCKIRVSYL